MPIKYTSTPWFFTPDFSSNAKVLIVTQMLLMIKYFSGKKSNADKYSSRSYSYIPKFLEKIKAELKITTFEFEEASNKSVVFRGNVLLELQNEVLSNRQKKYCREVFNTLALQISNEHPLSTLALNEYIDSTIDIVLR